MNLKAQRAAAMKAAQAIVQKAVDESRDLTEAEQSEVEAKTAEIKELDGKIASAAKSSELIGRIGSLAPSEETPASNDRAKSLGDHFVKHLGTRSLKEPGTVEAPFFKAATDTQATSEAGHGPLLTEVDRDFRLPVRQRLYVRDLLQQGTVSGNAITYPVFGALEGGTDTVAQGGQKPQMHVTDPTWITDRLKEVAGFFKMTDDMAEDLDYIVSEINSTALYDLALKEEQQLLAGNGAGNNLQGIRERSGVQAYDREDGDSVADAIFKAMSKVSTGSGRVADAIVINPVDYEALRLNKDGNGQYYGGGYFAGAYNQGGILDNPPVWGLRTVVTPSIEAGTVLVGAFGEAKVFGKGGVNVESTNSHDDDFTNDRITVRVKERIGLQVKYPASFVELTLDPVE